MPLNIPNDRSFEHSVKAVVAKNYPQSASRGLLNVTIEGTTSSGATATDQSSSDPNAPKLMFWGTSMWGGARVVL